MSDPTDPQELDPSEGAPGELDVEAPEADAAEQHTEVRPQGDEPLTGRELDEADPADAADQRRVVDLEEDEYRE